MVIRALLFTFAPYHKHKLNSASSVSSALKGLLDKDFVTKDKNTYRVYDQFFPLWLAFKGLI